LSFPILLYTHHLCGQQTAFDFKRTLSHTHTHTHTHKHTHILCDNILINVYYEQTQPATKREREV
jgi:hypothetical protein